MIANIWEHAERATDDKLSEIGLFLTEGVVIPEALLKLSFKLAL